MALDPTRMSGRYAREYFLTLYFKNLCSISSSLNAVIFIRIMHAFAGFYL